MTQSPEEIWKAKMLLFVYDVIALLYMPKLFWIHNKIVEARITLDQMDYTLSVH